MKVAETSWHVRRLTTAEGSVVDENIYLLTTTRRGSTEVEETLTLSLTPKLQSFLVGLNQSAEPVWENEVVFDNKRFKMTFRQGSPEAVGAGAIPNLTLERWNPKNERWRKTADLDLIEESRRAPEMFSGEIHGPVCFFNFPPDFALADHLKDEEGIDTVLAIGQRTLEVISQFNEVYNPTSNRPDGSDNLGKAA